MLSCHFQSFIIQFQSFLMTKSLQNIFIKSFSKKYKKDLYMIIIFMIDFLINYKILLNLSIKIEKFIFYLQMYKNKSFIRCFCDINYGFGFSAFFINR